MKVAALLTGKGQNTLRDKNLLPVRGQPLLYYPAMAARRSRRIGAFYASSDSRPILDAAAALGYERIVRPAELSRPDSRHVDAITHALDEMARNHGYQPDILVVLLANNISIRTEWIDESIDRLMADPSLSAVVPVYQDQDHHPYRAKGRTAEGTLRSFGENPGRDVSTNRQELPECFYLCHNFWTLNLHRSVRNGSGDPPWTFMGPRVAPLLVEESIDVHLQRDLLLCEDWLERHGISYD
jgi:CMP-N-acetylneuraminic acid synthetase